MLLIKRKFPPLSKIVTKVIKRIPYIKRIPSLKRVGRSRNRKMGKTLITKMKRPDILDRKLIIDRKFINDSVTLRKPLAINSENFFEFLIFYSKSHIVDLFRVF